MAELTQEEVEEYRALLDNLERASAQLAHTEMSKLGLKNALDLSIARVILDSWTAMGTNDKTRQAALDLMFAKEKENLEFHTKAIRSLELDESKARNAVKVFEAAHGIVRKERDA